MTDGRQHKIEWDQLVNGIYRIEIDESQITFFYQMYVDDHLLISIGRLLESICLCPKVPHSAAFIVDLIDCY